MKLLVFSVGDQTIEAPSSLPSGGGATAGKVLGNALNMFIVTGISITILFIIWSGIQWASSSGDKQKAAAAKGRLTWSIIGLVVMLGSVLIINLFNALFHVDLLNLQF